MIELDGSEGEAGGQMLRTALSLSALTGEPFHITNIRAGRPDPGLKPQHLTGVRMMQRLCSASVTGDDPGSMELEFHPGKMVPGTYGFDVGTAGSLTLLMQTALPALVRAPGRTELVLTGGTDVRWSPPIDHYALVLFPLLRRMGAQVNIEVMARGFYPKGGGRVRLTVEGGPLGPLRMDERGELVRVVGIANVQNLPSNVADRMIDAVLKEVPEAIVERSVLRGVSPGAVMTLAAVYENCILGWNALGERGVPAERVGEDAVGNLRSVMENGGTVDALTADQLLPFMALAGDSCFKVDRLTGHLKAQMAIIPRFLPVRFRVEEGRPHHVEVVNRT